MILLVPGWAADYPEFWNTIRRRNLWFIKLRYLAVISLIAFLLIGEFLLDFSFTSTQIQAIIFIDLSMLIYNGIIHYYRPKVGINPAKFNAMHLSLLQMLFDLAALMLLVYFTGTIDSPIYVFFIFHMVIGSLILPGIMVYTICGIVIGIFGILIFLQNISVVSSHYIVGIYSDTPAHPITYVVLFFLVFTGMMVITVLIANRIAKNLLRREEQLRTTLEILNEAEKAKQKYIMGVVHEIKSPISVSKSFVDLILQNYLGPVDEAVKEKLLRIRERSDEALHLINDILKISRLKLLESTNPEKMYLGDLLEECIDAKREEFESKNIKVLVYDTRKKKRTIMADKDLMELAVSNLVSNEVKYVPEGGNVQFNVSDAGDNVKIEIVDDGIGIPEKDLSHVFDQFYRAVNSRRQKFEGTGLGLSLVKEIIEHHGGNITVESPSGIGNTDRPGAKFTITIPYHLEEESEKEESTLKPLEGGL